MDEQALDRERIRREEQWYGAPTGESAVLDALERVEAERDVARRELAGLQESHLTAREKITRLADEIVQKDSAIAGARDALLLGQSVLAERTRQVARLTEERDRYGKMHKRACVHMFDAQEAVARLTEAIDAARDESLAQFELREAAEARVLRLQTSWTAEEVGEVALALADSVPSDDLTIEGWLKRAHAAENAIRSARREVLAAVPVVPDPPPPDEDTHDRNVARFRK